MNSLPASVPLVSIVIPFYDTYAQYFGACLDSVLQQSYPSWQVIVVDAHAETFVGEPDEL